MMINRMMTIDRMIMIMTNQREMMIKRNKGRRMMRIRMMADIEQGDTLVVEAIIYLICLFIIYEYILVVFEINKYII